MRIPGFDETEYLAANPDKAGLGLKIGPTHNPVAPKRQ